MLITPSLQEKATGPDPAPIGKAGTALATWEGLDELAEHVTGGSHRGGEARP